MRNVELRIADFKANLMLLSFRIPQFRIPQLLQHFLKIDLFPLGDDPQFVEGLGLDLPDPLPGDPELLADAVQGLGLSVDQTEPQSR